jgi:addiction module HigA family antidote
VIDVIKKEKHKFEPDYAVPPGDTLLETISGLNMDQKELSTRTGISTKTINLIIKGTAPLTPDTAVRLERVTGVPANFWSNLEANYREQLSRIENRKQLSSELAWLKEIPVNELVKRGIIKKQNDKIELLHSMLSFFGVNSVAAWKQLQPAASFRRATCFKEHPGATAAWLRLGEIEAQKVTVPPYSKNLFMKNLETIRAYTQKAPEAFEPEMIKLCNEAGVILVFIKEITGCRASGACRWLTSEKPLIQMNLRYRFNDHFWFTFFHEAGHILKGSKKAVFVDDNSIKDEEELKANNFATGILIPVQYGNELSELRTHQQVIQFAEKIGIAPGIVVGQLQHKQIMKYNQLNELKQKFVWKDEAA